MNIKREEKIKIVGLGLILFIAVAVLSNIIFFAVDNSINGIDSPNHLFYSLEFYQQLNDTITNKSLSAFAKIQEIKKQFCSPVEYSGIYWPNGLNAMTSVFYAFFGKTLFSAKLALLPYLIILLLATYYIGEYLYGKSIGFFAAVILFLYPIIFQSSRQFQLDFPLTSLVALTMLFLIKSELFSERKYSIYAGCALGITMLIKGQAMIFLIGPLMFIIYEVWRSLYTKKQSKKIVLFHFLLFLFFALTFAYLWWGGKGQVIFKSLQEHIFNSNKSSYENFVYNFDDKFSFKILTFYLRAMVWMLGPLGLCFFIFVGLADSKRILENKILLFWLLIPFVLFSVFFNVKSSRYLMPILPAIAVITANSLSNMKKYRYTMIFLMLFICLFQFAAFSLGSLEKNSLIKKTHVFFPLTGYEATPLKLKHNIEQVAAVLEKDKESNRKIKVGTVCTGTLDSFETMYWLGINSEKIIIIDIVQDVKRFAAELEYLDYLLFVTHARYGYSYTWPQGGLLWELLLRRFPYRTSVQDKNNLLIWRDLVSDLKAMESEFDLLSKTRDQNTGYNVYYLFKRKRE